MNGRAQNLRIRIPLRVSLLTLALAVLSLFTPPLRGAERVTLANGFAVNCDHHAPVGDKIRLFLSLGEDNYIEFPAETISAVEQVLVPAPAAATPASAGNQLPNHKLSQADLAEILSRAGKDHDVDVDLLASVVKAESGGNAHAVSSAGAQGLMQLMPSTAGGLGVTDSFEPAQNVAGGSAYLDALLTRYHDNLALALAAYNAGPAAVDRYRGIPPYRETRAYVARVIHEFNRRIQARESKARKAETNSTPHEANPALPAPKALSPAVD
jgi:hypothetical protein